MTSDTHRDPIAEVEDDTASTYVTFDLGEQILGVEVRHVREILDMRKITRLPNAPVDMRGVVDVRGVSVPVVDLKSRLGIPAVETGRDARIVVIEIGTETGRTPIGILADRVRKVDQIPRDEIEPCPGIGAGKWDGNILQGLSRRGPDLIVLLRLDAMFDDRAASFDLSAAIAC